MIPLSFFSRLALALPLFALPACDSSGEAEAQSSGESYVSPSISIVDFAGLEPALEAGRGEGMLLNFWAIWCAPCVAEMPELVEVAHEYRERGGRVIGVSYDLMIPGADASTIETTMREFLDGRRLDIPVLIYDDVDYSAINERFELPGEVPVTLAIDKNGVVVDRQEGKAGKQRFDEMMRKAMGL